MTGRETKSGTETSGLAKTVIGGTRSHLPGEEHVSGSATVILIWALLLLLAASPVFAQQKPLTIETSVMQPPVALGRPMLTWWDIKIPGSGLVVGRFRFDIKSEGYKFATAETEELTLNGPEQRVRVVLPPVNCPQYVDQLQVDISFEGARFKGPVGQQVLRIPFARKTVFLALVGESRTVRKQSQRRAQMIERLRFENLVPSTYEKRIDDPVFEHVKTVFASVDPSDMPSESLSYCGYDLVVLIEDEFRSLRKPQLEALLAWIRAGGALYLEPKGVLEPYHVDFLKRLTADDHRDLVFQLEPSGKLPEETIPDHQVAIAIQCGLGDLLLRTSDSDVDATPEEWLPLVAPLWKSRLAPVARPKQAGWTTGQDGQPQFQPDAVNYDPYALGMSAHVRYEQTQSDLLDRLMPDGVRMVPLSLLAFILLVFVCLIGPGDYFILGWLRIRKMTWLTFPLATIGVTTLTVWLSNSYMSTAETRRALVIRDLDRNGEIVRTNRFELLFIASTHRVTTEIEKGLFTPLNAGGHSLYGGTGIPGGPGFPAYGSMQNGMPGGTMVISGTMVINGQIVNIPGQGPIGGEVVSRTVNTEVQGRIPTQYEVKQNIAKWTPQLNRHFSIPGTAASPQIEWSAFDLHRSDMNWNNDHSIPPQVLAEAQKQFGSQAMVACFSGFDGWAYDRASTWRSVRSPDTMNNQLTEVQQQQMQMQRQLMQQTNFRAAVFGLSARQVEFEADLFRWLYQASVATADVGTFALTKQTTPKGGSSCDDLLLLDGSDPEAWLLAIIVPEKDDFVVYRKLMRFQD